MARVEGEHEASWGALGLLVGFLSGAGLMSHRELVDFFATDFYRFISIVDSEVIVSGRDMAFLLTAAVSYFFVLCIIGVAATRLAISVRDQRVKAAAVGALFLVLSFLGLYLHGANSGYHELQVGLEELRAERPVIPKWIW